jgi:hypothetical protein
VHKSCQNTKKTNDNVIIVKTDKIFINILLTYTWLLGNMTKARDTVGVRVLLERGQYARLKQTLKQKGYTYVSEWFREQVRLVLNDSPKEE